MFRKYISTLVVGLVGIAMLGIAGCYGPSPGQEPTMTIKLPEEISANNFFVHPGQVVRIEGEITANDEDNLGTIVESYFVSEPELPGSRFLWSGTNIRGNDWLVPPVTQTTPVSIVWKIKTLAGHESETKLNLIIVPDPE